MLHYALSEDLILIDFFYFQVGSAAQVNGEATHTMLQKFWDSAMELTPDDDDETRRLCTLLLIHNS